MMQAEAGLVEKQDRGAQLCPAGIRRDASGERARRPAARSLRSFRRICAWPSRRVSASLRAVTSREIPTSPTTWPLSSRSGTFVDEIHTFRPLGSMTYSSKSMSGRPVSTMRRSSARYFRAASAGCSSRSVLPIRSPDASRPICRAVALLAMTKRLAASFTHRLSGTRSISLCREIRSATIALRS